MRNPEAGRPVLVERLPFASGCRHDRVCLRRTFWGSSRRENMTLWTFGCIKRFHSEMRDVGLAALGENSWR